MNMNELLNFKYTIPVLFSRTTSTITYNNSRVLRLMSCLIILAVLLIVYC